MLKVFSFSLLTNLIEGQHVLNGLYYYKYGLDRKRLQPKL